MFDPAAAQDIIDENMAKPLGERLWGNAVPALDAANSYVERASDQLGKDRHAANTHG